MTGVPTELAEYRIAFRQWLDAHRNDFDRGRAPTFEEHMTRGLALSRSLWHAGWKRVGWPESVGGLGGSPLLRTELGAALAVRDFADPGLFSLIEVLAPSVIDFASPQLASEMVPRLLSGTELWCQGFSEPETGSDLASLRCSAVPDGGTDDASTWVINGQKVWTSLAQYSDRCVLLARTGSTVIVCVARSNVFVRINRSSRF